MYGSVSNTKVDKVESSIIENLGFEITRDKTINKEDKYVWFSLCGNITEY